MPYSLAGDGRDVGGQRDRFALGGTREGRRRFANALPTVGMAAWLNSGIYGGHWASEGLTTSGWFGVSANTITALSMSMWVNQLTLEAAISNGGLFGVQWSNGNGVSGLGFAHPATLGQVNFHVGVVTTATQNAIISGVTSGVWHHLAGTWTTTGTPTMSGFLNSVAVTDTGTRNSAHVISGGRIVLGLGTVSGGTNYTNPSQWSHALVRECAIWNRTLTAAEVATLYNSGQPYDITGDAGLATGLRGWWRCGDGQGDCPEVIRDQSGNPTPIHLYPQAHFKSGRPQLVYAP